MADNKAILDELWNETTGSAGDKKVVLDQLWNETMEGQSTTSKPKSQGAILNFLKGAYEAEPKIKLFGLDIPISSIAIPGLGTLSEERKAAEELYPNVQPTGGGEQLAGMAGNALVNAAAASPFMAGAGALPLIGKSAMLTGGLGMGAYAGTKSALEGRPLPETLKATGQGIKQGLVWGGLSRGGATVLGKLPFGETIGSAVGGGVAGAMTSEEKDRGAATLFGALMGAAFPTERYDITRKIAELQGWKSFKNLGENVFDIPKDTTGTIEKWGWDEVEKVGGDPNTPSKALNNAQSGMRGARQILSDFYRKILYINKKQMNAETTGQLINELKEMTDKIGDPTSPIVKLLDKTVANILGVETTYTESGKFRAGGREETIRGIPRDIQKQIIAQLKESGVKPEVTLNALHNMKVALGDFIPSNIWNNPQRMNFEQKIARDMGNFINEVIGARNPHYKMASNQWHKMKGIEKEVYDLSLKDVTKDWNLLEPAARQEFVGNINSIERYFKDMKLGQYQIKTPLEKYHAYQSWTDPKKMAGFVKGMQISKPIMAAGSALGIGLGKALGLPGIIGGGTLGGLLGYMKGAQMRRPVSWTKYLKELKPKGP